MLNFNDIKDKYGACKKCTNCLTDTKVFGWGNKTPRIAIVGEGPGKEEVEKGIPFVGPAGQLLDKILGAIDLRREDLYFTNAISCRTDEKNRTPTSLECTNCKDRLFEELSLVKPEYIILVGATALKTIFGDDKKVTEEHGQWFTTMSLPCYYYYILLHPAWILHSTSEGETQSKKRMMWNDIRRFSINIKDMSISDTQKKEII